MRRIVLTLTMLAASVAALPASAAVVADYQDEFGGTGWSYLTNSNGPLGNPANYTPLTLSGGGYSAPGTSAVAGKSAGAPDPVAYPPVPTPAPLTYVRCGPGRSEGPTERALIIAYEFTATDLAAAGATGQGLAYFSDFSFAVSSLASIGAGVSQQ